MLTFLLMFLESMVVNVACEKGKIIINIKSNINITSRSYVKFNNRQFKVDHFAEFKVSNIDHCIEKCSNATGCTSMNYQHPKCYLIDKTRHSSKEQFVNIQGTTHISLMNKGCDSGKCKNNATCIPHFNNNTYQCNCTTGSYGKHCEYKKTVAQPNWWFKFRGDTINYGISSEDATISVVNEQFDKGYFYGQPDVPGKYFHCHLRCTKTEIKWPRWNDLTLSTDGITVMMWIQFWPGEEERQKDSAFGRSHILSPNYRGIAMAYERQQWLFEYFGNWKYKRYIPFKPEESLSWHFIAMSVKEKEKMVAFVNDNFEIDESAEEHFDPAHPMLETFHPRTPCIFDMTDFRVWYRALTINEIEQLYNDEKKRFKS